jgi:hypothetical protein
MRASMKFYSLSPRAVAPGGCTILSVSVKTLEFHTPRILQQLDIHTTADLTKYAITHGITGLSPA